MSESDSPQSSLHGKEDDTQGVNSPQAVSENPEIASEIETAAEEKEERGNRDKPDHHRKEFEEIKVDPRTNTATVSSKESSEKQIAEDDDGFKTPTSSDHKIPPITECPLAPRKARPQSSKLKRKASPPPAARRSLDFDASTEVESIFRPTPNQDNVEHQHKIKKARRDDQD